MSKGLAADAFARMRREAYIEDVPDFDVKQLVRRPGENLAERLIAMALVFQIERDEELGRKAVALFERMASGVDPKAFYQAVDSDFFATEYWPKAFAFAWDWLYEAIPTARRARLLASLESWSDALYQHTESWWWNEATYNCGAIPVGAQGLLLTAIQGESQHPQFSLWFTECLRKVRDNYFPLTWRANGLCNEGPGYAHYHENPTQFADAFRRTGGPNIIPQSGAVNAMHYLRHQWMPQGRCGTVGDNTEYGRRVFQSIYLLGIREMRDAAGLWTFETYADRDRTEDYMQFLYYPDGLVPASPGSLNLRTSHYFEFDKNRAGLLFSRSQWDNERAHWFAFSTRSENANHAHYDMNSFVFTAFGEEFAAHTNVFPYSHKHHGADIEHNIVIIDDGGMPIADRSGSAGDDGSILGLLTGCATGDFGDYVRGDARRSYADRSVESDKPAIQADRSVVFVKEGSNPYVVIADNIRKDDAEHDYHWQWYTRAQAMEGQGNLDDPFRVHGERYNGKIVFLAPQSPTHDFRVVKNEAARRTDSLGLLRVHIRGMQAHYFALGIAWEQGASEPTVQQGPPVHGAPDAKSLIVNGDGFQDLILWQPGSIGQALNCGPVETNGLITVVRGFSDAAPASYILGDGSQLRVGGKQVVEAPRPCSVSANAQRSVITGGRRAESAETPFPAKGRFWLPSSKSEVWEDATRIAPPIVAGNIAVLA